MKCALIPLFVAETSNHSHRTLWAVSNQEAPCSWAWDISTTFTWYDNYHMLMFGTWSTCDVWSDKDSICRSGLKYGLFRRTSFRMRKQTQHFLLDSSLSERQLKTLNIFSFSLCLIYSLSSEQQICVRNEICMRVWIGKNNLFRRTTHCTAGLAGWLAVPMDERIRTAAILPSRSVRKILLGCSLRKARMAGSGLASSSLTSKHTLSTIPWGL